MGRVGRDKRNASLLHGTMHGGVVQERMEGCEGPLEAFRSFSEAIQHPDP